MVSREVWSAGEVRRPWELTIDNRIAVAGDVHVLPSALHHLSSPTASCLVLAVDLTPARGSWRAKRLLGKAKAVVTKLTRSFSRVRHVVVVYAAHPDHDRAALARTAESLAAGLHAYFERRRGSYVEVLSVDVTGCHRPALLDVRITELASTTAGAAGNRVIQWEDLAHKSLHRASMDDLS